MKKKENRAKLLIARYTDSINTMQEYYHVLGSAPYQTSDSVDESDMEPIDTLEDPANNLRKWLNKAHPLREKVQEIYISLESKLGLPYDSTCLAWGAEGVEDVRDKLLQIEQKLIELRDKEIWKLEKEARTIQDKVKEFFKKHRKWLIPAIASTITGIIGPIIAWIVIRKLGG